MRRQEEHPTALEFIINWLFRSDGLYFVVLPIAKNIR